MSHHEFLDVEAFQDPYSDTSEHLELGLHYVDKINPFWVLIGQAYLFSELQARLAGYCFLGNVLRKGENI